MNNQPQPTKGEWTVESVEALVGQTFNGAWAIADAHHMEACRALLKVPEDEVLYGAIKELMQQLAAERDERSIIERSRDAWQYQVAELGEQLASEREKIQTLVDALMWLRDELKDDEYYIEKIDIALAKAHNTQFKTIAALMQDAEKQLAAFRAALDTEREKYQRSQEKVREYFESLAIEQQKRTDIEHHMEACRALLNVPDDEVLYDAIKELMQQQSKTESEGRLHHNRMARELAEACRGTCHLCDLPFTNLVEHYKVAHPKPFIAANANVKEESTADEQELLERLKNHIMGMAPQQKDRHQGKLLIEVYTALSKRK